MPEASTLETERLPKKSLREVIDYIGRTPHSDSEALHSAEMKVAELHVGESWTYTDPSDKGYKITKVDEDYFTLEDLEGSF